MMQSPILRTKKFLEKKRSQSVDLLEGKLFDIDLLEGKSLEKKKCEKKLEKPRGYKSLHSSEYVELTQLNPK